MVAISLVCISLIGCTTIGYCDATASIREAIKLYDEGKNLYNREEYRKAVEYFQKVVNDSPESDMTEVAMYYLGSSYEHMGNYDKAITIYGQLIDKYKRGFWVKAAKKDIKEIKKKQ
ncbi:MAG: tol-pal system YbgF family protein [Candidatus Omnitrophota bacterium]